MVSLVDEVEDKIEKALGRVPPLAHHPKIQPVIFRPFNARLTADIKRHVTEVRRMFDWPGMPYHDAQHPEHDKFNRWYVHNLPLLVQAHHHPKLAQQVARVAGGETFRPSYVFLSMYGRDGICPLHTDRPQCHMTVDYMVDSDAVQKPWPIYIDDKPYSLQPGEAVVYSGTQQPHYRKPLREDSDANFANLAFFHFVPASFMGPRD